MPTNFVSSLPLISIVISLFVLIGGFVAFRHGYSSTTIESQAKTIEALEARVKTLEAGAAADKHEIARLKRQFLGVNIALKEHGLSVEAEDDAIILINNQSRQKRTVIQITDEHTRVDKEEAP